MSEERLPVHPYAELFPLMQHPDFDALCGHIATNGLQEEIVLYEGQILDGRNRYLACLAGGLVGLGGTGHELAGGLGRSDPQMAKSTLAR